MKVTIAIDSLKGSLSSLEAGSAIGEGVKKAWPEAEVCVRPLADGGEGTVEAVVSAMGGEIVTLPVTGPLGSTVDCSYGVIAKSKTAVLEMAGAAGITLLKDGEKNPMVTTTYGVGEVIRDGIKRGCRHFLVGIGGSATNDGGVGMLQALGFGMLDEKGNQVPFGAQGLEALCRIEDGDAMPELKECTFRIACDVTNPLCGPWGCSAIYGPQKGADEEMIARMDRWMEAYGALVEKKYPGTDSKTPGCGAAGGIGFAFYAFLGGVLESGIKIVLEETRLADYVKDADIVVTGEGRLDGQTVMGKAPIGVAKTAKEYGKKVIAFSGSVTKDAIACNAAGIDAFFPILRRIVTLKEAMDPAAARENMTDTSEQVFRLIRACMK